MKLYKRTLFYLILLVMAFGAVINVIYAVNEDLYKTLHLYLKWALAFVAILMIVNEIRNRNKPETNFENQVKSNAITFGRKKLFFYGWFKYFLNWSCALCNMGFSTSRKYYHKQRVTYSILYTLFICQKVSWKVRYFRLI